MRAVRRVGLTFVTLATKPLKLKLPAESTTASGRVGGATGVRSSGSTGGSACSALWFLAFLTSRFRIFSGLLKAGGLKVQLRGRSL